MSTKSSTSEAMFLSEISRDVTSGIAAISACAFFTRAFGSPLLNLAPFGRHRVHLVPMPNLARAEIFGNGPYPLTDVLTVQIKRRSVSFDPAHGDMDVRVFGIEK